MNLAGRYRCTACIAYGGSHRRNLCQDVPACTPPSYELPESRCNIGRASCAFSVFAGSSDVRHGCSTDAMSGSSTTRRPAAVRRRPNIFCLAADPCERRFVSGLRRCPPGLTPAAALPKPTAPGPASWATLMRGAGCALCRTPTSARHRPAAVAQQLYAGAAPVCSRLWLHPWKAQVFVLRPCILRCRTGFSKMER